MTDGRWPGEVASPSRAEDRWRMEDGGWKMEEGKAEPEAERANAEPEPKAETGPSQMLKR